MLFFLSAFHLRWYLIALRFAWSILWRIYLFKRHYWEWWIEIEPLFYVITWECCRREAWLWEIICCSFIIFPSFSRIWVYKLRKLLILYFIILILFSLINILVLRKRWLASKMTIKWNWRWRIQKKVLLLILQRNIKSRRRWRYSLLWVDKWLTQS